jgi:hypothetical protein
MPILKGQDAVQYKQYIWLNNDISNWAFNNIKSQKPELRMRKVVKHRPKKTKFQGYAQVNWAKMSK